MPKSKRNKVTTLSKTTKKVGLEFKQNMIDKIRQSVDDYSNLFVFSVDNMRNTHLQAVRDAWKSENKKGLFFMGKNRVMAVALGREESEEYNELLHRVSKLLRGSNRGLMFTNEDPLKVEAFFESHREPDFARTNGTATDDVTLPEGPLPQFGHAMEPQLRAMGMPTSLKRGVITLLAEYPVCKKGDKLTSEQARILKLLGHKQAEFKIDLIALWSKDVKGDASFRMLVDGADLEEDGATGDDDGADEEEDEEEMSDQDENEKENDDD